MPLVCAVGVVWVIEQYNPTAGEWNEMAAVGLLEDTLIKHELRRAMGNDATSKGDHIVEALRDALSGIQTPATWIYTQSETDKIVAQQDQQTAAASGLAAAETASNVVSNLAGAVKDGAAAGPQAAVPA